MTKRKTTEEFIEDAIRIHGEKYDYSKVKYISSKKKVIVICPKHGEFLQTPNNYLRGCGCPKCIGKAKLNTKEFIKRSKKVHGSKYSYDKANFKRIDLRVAIICPKHGEFFQRAGDHMKGRGCAKCAGIAKSNTKEFVEKAKEIHKDKYDYSKVEYINCDTKVIIICRKHGEFLQTPYCHLQTQGCPKCAGKAKLNTKEFIKRSKKVHGNRYNYSRVKYINCKTKVKIICQNHGVFVQSSDSHIRGQGCPKCSGSGKKTTEEFIEDAINIHGEKYNYSKVKYINSKKKVIIICPKHGKFKQTPNCHLRGNGCPDCKKLDTERFIKKAKNIHNNKYDYSKVKYAHNKLKITIICRKHGEFFQNPSNHLQGNGCPKCAGVGKSNMEEFIEKAKNVHGNKYDYSNGAYQGSFRKIKIICHKHGSFLQCASSHLQGSGCPKCVGPVSKSSQVWLDSLGIPINQREKAIRINGNLFRLDAIDEKNKIVYEFNGDFWHGNPEKFASNEINPICNKTFGELYRMTIDKEQTLKKAGYTVISIWESDFQKSISD